MNEYKTSYNVFKFYILSLLSKKSLLKILSEQFLWEPKNTKEKTSEFLYAKLREQNLDCFDIKVEITNKKTGEKLNIEVM